ncbi:MAG: type II secretion system protein GspD [Parachlamydiales bacterium]|nr:type II secretion system protein GspD [Parachlamydiales bacterium]
MIKKIVLIILLFSSTYIYSDENILIEEKSKNVNESISNLKDKLLQKYDEIQILFSKNANDSDFENLFSEIKALKENIKNIENSFRKDAIEEGLKTDEGYAFWDQGETTISQLIMEYGSQEYLYVVPHELGSMKINLYSTIPIPKESWDEMIFLILSQNGIGIKKLNPFLRQLYILKHDPAYIEAIVSSQKDLNLIEDTKTIAYVFSPDPEQVRSVQSFLERFSDMKHTTVQAVKTNVIVVGSKQTIERLVNLYEKVFEKAEGKVIKVLALKKVGAEDAHNILKAFFSETNAKTRPSFYQSSSDDLSIIPQGSSLILIGDERLIKRAEGVLNDLENQLDDPSDMTFFWYTCKNSNPEDLAEVLEKLYYPMNSAKVFDKTKEIIKDIPSTENSLPSKPKLISSHSTNIESKENATTNNFVVDAKTNSILMVVKKEEIEKIKSLLKKLDVPKQMVRIDVLLVERKIRDKRQTGINLLKIGSSDGETKKEKGIGISFDGGHNSERKGLLDFLFYRASPKLPSFDLAMSFLMAQDDMKISDCPSVLAVNQTAAKIKVVDQISINNGAVPIDTQSGPKYENSYQRAEFGTIIEMTPTIHPAEDNDSKGSVTIHTDITFDTQKTTSGDNDRPPVTKRHIENEIRVIDGETIILGGLRRKTKEEESEKIPFLGEIPGIGKLFGSTKSSDITSEMFIFITPHIIKNSSQEYDENNNLLLQRRVGDIDEFLEKLEISKKDHKKKMFENSLKLFF